MSLLELINLIENILDKKLKYNYSNWRPGDQKIYISDINKLNKDINWSPFINKEKGVLLMIDWIKDNKKIFKKLNLI